MMPKGCQFKGTGILCHSVDSEVRGQLLANFQLFALVFCVLGGVAVLYGFAAMRFGGSTSDDFIMGSQEAENGLDHE